MYLLYIVYFAVDYELPIVTNLFWIIYFADTLLNDVLTVLCVHAFLEKVFSLYIVDSLTALNL